MMFVLFPNLEDVCWPSVLVVIAALKGGDVSGVRPWRGPLGQLDSKS
jgi:hypothetical protein